MKREKIIVMLEDIIENLDYDLYKEIFVYDEEQDSLEKLINIVEKYI